MTKKIELPFIMSEAPLEEGHAQGSRIDLRTAILGGTSHDVVPGRPKEGYLLALQGTPPDGVNSVGQRTDVAVNRRDVSPTALESIPGRRVFGNRILEDLQAQRDMGIPQDKILPIKYRQLVFTYRYTWQEAVELYRQGNMPNRYQKEKMKRSRTPQ